MNNQDKQKLRHRQQHGDYQRERRWGAVKGRGVECMVTEGDLTLGGGHTA